MLPLLILLALTLVSLSSLYYTHNLLKQTAKEVAFKTAQTFRQEFFLNTEVSTEESFKARLTNAIREDNDFTKLDLSFLDQANGLNISFKDLSSIDEGEQENSFVGALTLVYRGDLETAVIEYDSGLIPAQVLNACSNLNSGESLKFKPYILELSLVSTVGIRLMGFEKVFTISESGSQILAEPSKSDICQIINAA